MLCPSVMVFFFVPQNSLNPNISRPPSLFLYHTGRLNGEEQRDEEKTKEPGVAGDSSDEYEDIENEGEFGGEKPLGSLLSFLVRTKVFSLCCLLQAIYLLFCNISDVSYSSVLQCLCLICSSGERGRAGSRKRRAKNSTPRGIYLSRQKHPSDSKSPRKPAVRSGDEVIVDTLLTYSIIDVMWQVGSPHIFICCFFCIMIQHKASLALPGWYHLKGNPISRSLPYFEPE